MQKAILPKIITGKYFLRKNNRNAIMLAKTKTELMYIYGFATS